MRYIFSCVFGIAVSLALFLMMTYLIEDYEPLPVTPVVETNLIFAELDKPEPVIDDFDKLEPPPPVTPTPLVRHQDFPIERLNPIDMPLPPTPVQLTTGSVPGTAPQPPTLGKFPPPDVSVLVGSKVKYPAAAERSNLEGFVLVENTVDKYGTVIGVRIIESSHNVFEKAAREAVLKWKYSRSELNQRVDKKRIAFNLD